MRYKAFYYQGGNTDKPGPINIVVARKGIKLVISMKQFIGYDDIISVSNDYQVIDKEFSSGKAVAGGILFGGLGALAGGAMGGEKVKAYLKVRYRFGDEQRELVLGASSGLAEKLKNDIEKKIGQSSTEPKQKPDLLKYHKKFYGGTFNAARALLDSKKRKD